VTSAYDNGWSEPLNTAHRRAHRFLKEASVPLFAAEAGQAFELGEGRLEVLHPSLPRIDRAPEAGNNSVVLRLRWGQCSFLWAGGMEKAGEEALLARADDVKADWLRVARFGTGHASSPEWLRAVAPEYAVISSAADQDRFPHPETVGRLVAAGVTLFRTDRSDEPLFFFCDGNAITTP
jgi:competence protein ComEC